MITQYPPNYAADNLDYRVVNETREIVTDADKIIVLDFGSYFTSSLVVKNAVTGQTLRRNTDYTCVVNDFVAMKESGKEVSKRIVIKSKAVKSVSYSYMFVGGQHLNGLHLLRKLREIYPDGIETKAEWDKTTDKPETFKPKFHQMHVKDLYGFEGAAASLDRMTAGIKRGSAENQNRFMTNVLVKLDSMKVELKDELDNLDDYLSKTFDELAVQDGEYIFTDSKANPAIARGYGTWRLVTNTILRGNNDTELAIDDGNVLNLGDGQIVRNCYIWRNSESNNRPTYQFTVDAVSGYSGVNRPENTDLTVRLKTTGVATGTKIRWIIYDEQTKKVVDKAYIVGNTYGHFTVDESGNASMVVKFKPSTVTAKQNRNYSIKLTNNSNLSQALTVVDTSNQRRVLMEFHSASDGRILTSSDEGTDVILKLTAYGYAVGESIFLDWSYSSIDSSSIATTLPNILTNPSGNVINYKIHIKENMLNDGPRLLSVYSVDSLGEAITEFTSNAAITINDTSVYQKAIVNFLNGSGNLVSEVDEGVAFKIAIDTNLVKTDIEILYESTKSLSGFTNLTSLLKTDDQGNAVISTGTTEDFLTATGAQSLVVMVYHQGVEIGRNQIFIKDTSKSPEYSIYFSKTPKGVPITRIAEGETFYFNVTVPGWVQPSSPPVLNFLYIINQNTSTSVAELNSRLTSELYQNMAFGSSAVVFNGVSWTGGDTLSLKFVAIANNTVDGLDTFTIAMKQFNETDYFRSASVEILDTSIYDITATWSSSATQLVPITQADEMLSTGLSNTVYLWIDVDGDGSLMGDITLSTTKASEFVTVFPKVIRFPKGSNRQVVAVNILADFVKDGNMDITVVGKYVIENTTETNTIFTAPLKIIDNSVVTSMVLGLRDVNDITAPLKSEFSEWYSIYGTFTFPAFAFISVIRWSITYNTPGASNQFQTESGEITVPAGASSASLILEPIRDRVQDGTVSFNVVHQRFIKADNRPITSTDRHQSMTLLDDSVPPAVTVKYYSDAAATTQITSANEGATIYAKVTTNNPDRNSAILLRGTYATETAVTIASASYSAIGNDTMANRVTFDNSKILAKYALKSTYAEYSVIVPIKVIADRATNAKSLALSLTAYLINDTDSYTVGSVIDPTLASVTVVTTNTAAVPINDTSKTASYSVSPGSATVNEGVQFNVVLNITNGTVGDVYYPSLNSTFDVNRLDVNELGLEQLSVTTSDALTWKFQAKANRITNASNNIFNVNVINKTTGTVAGTAIITIADTSKTPSFFFYAMDVTASTNATRTTINEGDANMAIFVGNEANLLPDENIKFEWVSGRAASEFVTTLFTGTHDLDVAYGNSAAVRVPFYPKYDHKTNTADENTVTIKATTTISNISKTLTIAIGDTSQNPAVLDSRWVLASDNSTVVTSVNEGQAVVLQVKINGGAETLAVTCANNGGRSANRLAVSSYGKSVNRTSDSTWVNFPFTPSLDGITNSGNETKLSVRLSVASVGLTFDSTLPINDTSTNSSYVLKIIELNDSTQTARTHLLENKTYQIIASGTNIASGTEVQLNANNNTYYHSSQSNQYISGHNGTVNFTPTSFILANSERTPTGSLWYSANILVDGNVVASINLPVIDNAVTQITGKITTVEDINTAISTAVTGNTVSLVINPDQLAGIDWNIGTSHVIRWKLVNSTTGATINNPNESNSNVTFNKSNLTTFNGGSGYKVNIPLTTSIPVGDVKVVFTEEYVVAGVTHVVTLGETNKVSIIAGATAPAITGMYYSTNQQGTNTVTSAKEGETVYLIIKTVNIPKDTSINVNWDGSTTNSDDFLTATTDNDVSVKVSTYNTADNSGLGYYTLDTLFDEKVDFGKNITSVKLVTNTSTMQLATSIEENDTIYLVIETLGLRTKDKVNLTLQADMGTGYYLEYGSTKLYNGSTFSVNVGEVNATTMVGKTTLTLVAKSTT